MGEFPTFSGNVTGTGNGGGDGGGGELSAKAVGGARCSNRSLWYFCMHPKIEYSEREKGP